MEHWKNIIETAGKYQVSDLGRVKSIKTNRIIKSNYSNTGYLRFSACFNGRHKTLYVHKIEFEAFVANHILSKNIYVFHKNKVNDDNRLDNLYVDSSESDIPKNENFKVISETDGKYSVGNLGDDHNELLDYFGGMDWKELHQQLNIVRLVPETKFALIGQGQELNQRQRDQLNNSNYQVAEY